MRICNCQNPRTVINPATGESLRVRCGKCSSCLNAKAKNWINRLLEESQHHRYAFMVNLTYDDHHLPMLTLDTNNDLVWYNRRLPLRIPLIDYSLVLDNSHCPDKEWDYFYGRLNNKIKLPALCFNDIQLFNKRLNKYIHDKFTGVYGNFRYFVCGEYGPSTFRPHYHAIYWLDSRSVAEHFSEIVSTCWKNGDSSVAHIYSKGGLGYVAQYVNMSVHLPAIYSLPSLRQRHIFSKCPPIGSPQLLATEIRRVYDTKPIKRTVFDSSSGKYVTLPVSSSFKDRFFPKCEGYSRKSRFGRVGLYRACEFFPSEGYDEFSEAVYTFYSRTLSNRFEPTKENRFLVSWVRDLCMHSKEPDKVNVKLYKIYMISKRFLYLRNSLGLTSGQLMDEIDDYYKKLDYERLKDFYTFQQEYSFNHSVSDLIHMYPDFVDYLFKLKDISDVPDYYRLALFSFGLDFYSLIPDLNDSYDFKQMKDSHDKIYKDTHKRHDINNYRYSQRFKDLNSDLQKVILNYAT